MRLSSMSGTLGLKSIGYGTLDIPTYKNPVSSNGRGFMGSKVTELEDPKNKERIDRCQSVK
jgi:hypothetical protein